MVPSAALSSPAVQPVEDAFLGVERSLTGRRWVNRAADERTGLMLAQRLGVPEVVGRAMAARGIDADGAEAFLEPSLRVQMPNPSKLAGMDDAAARLVRAVREGEPIAVFGDYDVDGATSSALLARFFAAAGVPLRIYIPDRMKEGYGPNTPALMRLRSEGVRVIITVDCGITAYEPLAEAADAGLDVVVVDHHAAQANLPRAVAVVNPNRLDDSSGLGQLAAVGVAFLLAVAVNRGLREAGCYENRREPDLLSLLDLVALGTICDVVPLTGLNRAFVTQGLKVMSRRENAGLAALADVARVNEKPDAYHAGFLLGPRVNAGGRVGEAGLGARLLTVRDAREAADLAEQLDGYNKERQEIEAGVLAEALAQVEDAGPSEGVVFAVGEGWHAGVIGIVAGRLRERYHLPAVVVAVDGDVGKGSARSVGGVDLGSAVLAARQAGLLINGGGHKMAAGLTVARDRIEALRAFLSERVGAEILANGITPTLVLDGALRVAGADLALIKTLGQLAPFGAGNSEPRFVLPGVRVVQASVVGNDHVRCILTDETGGRLKGIAFRAAGEPLGQALMDKHGLPLHIAGKLRLDRWQGREGAQLLIDDGARA